MIQFKMMREAQGMIESLGSQELHQKSRSRAHQVLQDPQSSSSNEIAAQNSVVNRQLFQLNLEGVEDYTGAKHTMQRSLTCNSPI